MKIVNNNKKIFFFSFGIIILLLSILSLTLLSVITLNNTSFVLTNTELVNGNIQLSQIYQDTSINPIWSNVQSKVQSTHSPWLVAFKRADTSYPGSNFYPDPSSAGQVCSSYSGSFVSGNLVSAYYWRYSLSSSQYWGTVDRQMNGQYYSSIICSLPKGFNLLGDLVLSTPIILNSEFNTLTLDYNITSLNGGSITPTLIVNGVEKSLDSNNMLKGNFLKGTEVLIKFSLKTLNKDLSPSLNKNIILNMDLFSTTNKGNTFNDFNASSINSNKVTLSVSTPKTYSQNLFQNFKSPLGVSLFILILITVIVLIFSKKTMRNGGKRK